MIEGFSPLVPILEHASLRAIQGSANDTRAEDLTRHTIRTNDYPA